MGPGLDSGVRRNDENGRPGRLFLGTVGERPFTRLAEPAHDLVVGDRALNDVVGGLAEQAELERDDAPELARNHDRDRRIRAPGAGP